MPTDLDQDKRSGLMDRISALLAKTRANGCTEAEAMAAAELAQKLMTKYGLSLAELEQISSPFDACETDGTPIGDRRCHEVVHLSNAIAYYTDTKCWYQRHGIINLGKGRLRAHREHRGIILVYFGLSADIQTAIYLTQILRVALDTEWRAYWKAMGTAKISPRTARANFMLAMTSRLTVRLMAMKDAQSKAESNNCRAIVLAKERIVGDAYKATGIKPS